MKNYYKEYLDENGVFSEWTINDTHEDILDYIRYLPPEIKYKYLVCLQVDANRQFLTLFNRPDYNIKTS